MIDISGLLDFLKVITITLQKIINQGNLKTNLYEYYKPLGENICKEELNTLMASFEDLNYSHIQKVFLETMNNSGPINIGFSFSYKKLVTT